MNTRRKKRESVLDEVPISVINLEGDTQCLICEAEFLDTEDLKMHIEQVHTHGIMVCKFCNANISGPDEYVRHFIRSHLDMALICFYCHRIFLNRTALKQHELKHRVVPDEPLTCSHCTETFASRRELQKHEYNLHMNSDEGVLLNDLYSLLSGAVNMHVLKFFDAIAKNNSFTCLMCNHFSTSIIDYVNHLTTSYCKSYVCDKCFRIYKRKDGVLRHITKHPHCQNISVDVMKKCHKCEKLFNEHEINDHKELCKAKKCKTCDAVFTSVCELVEHRVSEHKASQAVTLFPCIFCKKEYVGEASLKKHVDRVHQNQHLYKYNCSYCSYRFMHPKNLFGHFFTRHKDISPYTCKICDKKFRIRKKFSIHIKLEHKSVGFVEFNENLHVIFTDKKSEKPFLPATMEGFGCDTEKSNDNEEKPSKEEPLNVKEIVDKDEQKPNENTVDTANNKNKIEETAIDSSQDAVIEDQNNENSEGGTTKKQSDSKTDKRPKKPTQKHRMNGRVKRLARRPRKTVVDSDTSEDEPLIKRKKKVNNKNNKNVYTMLSGKRNKRFIRSQTAKLTCNKCNKYCYTFQNYQHHMSLHERKTLKKCIKCLQCFKSKDELNNHINTAHSTSKLTETLKTLLEKRQSKQTSNNSSLRPAEVLQSTFEQRRKAQLIKDYNTNSNKFRRTLKKVDVPDDSTTVTITPLTEHGLSVKKYIENFKPDVDGVNISSSVTLKVMAVPVDRKSFIKMTKFREEPVEPITGPRLRMPQKFKEDPNDTNTSVKVTVRLVQELITKPSIINFTLDDRVPTVSPTPVEEEDNDYCNTFADDTDYTQYKNEAIIPEVAHEVMLGEVIHEDIPKTRQLAQEVYIPNIPEEHGDVSIGHLLPQAPFYKIVKVKKLLNPPKSKPKEGEHKKGIELPDGTQLVTVTNPFAHLIPNEHLQKVVKANTNKYYTPRVKNVEWALMKALSDLDKPRAKYKAVKTKKGNAKLDTDSIHSSEQTVDTNQSSVVIETNESIATGDSSENVETYSTVDTGELYENVEKNQPIDTGDSCENFDTNESSSIDSTEPGQSFENIETNKMS